MELQIKYEFVKPDACVVSVKGPVDSMTYLDFKDRIQVAVDQGARHLLLNLSGVKYISSSGLGVLFEFQKKLEGLKGSLAFYDLQLSVKRVLEIVKAESLEIRLENLDPSHPFFEYLHKQASA